MDEREPVVMRQTTITLPFLDDEVPALYLADGRPYIPVFAVCRALGIPAASSIRRWRNLALWVTARKLPFQTREQGKRLVRLTHFYGTPKQGDYTSCCSKAPGLT